MTRHKQPFTDTAQLGELNQEVWKTLEGGQEPTEKMKSRADDAAPPSPSAVVGDDAGSPPPDA